MPDLPGCVATGLSREATLDNIREAIAFHLDGMRERGQRVPEPGTDVDYVEVA